MTAAPSPADIDDAARWLAAGGVVAMPTETVYGLAADATNTAAVAAIFRLKGRPADHPLIVHLPTGTDPAPWVTAIPPVARRLMAAFWPGPLTLVLRRSARIPASVTGGQDTVALRCPDHPVAQALLAAFAQLGSGVVAAPSANRFGHVSPTTARHVRDEFGADVGPVIRLLDGGACRVGIESSIVSIADDGPLLLRPGSIGLAELSAAAGVPVVTGGGSAAPRVPGSLAAHYAPRTPLRLVDAATLGARVRSAAASGQRIAVLAFGAVDQHGVVWRQMAPDSAGYARDLYAALRDLDTSGATEILVESPPAMPEWAAVHDRLARAATGSGGP